MRTALSDRPAGARAGADLDRTDGAHRERLEPAGASPANLAAPGGYSLYEGIVETDEWFGPLFTNLRLTQTHKPVHLKADYPLLQVQPLPREAYAEHTLSATAIVPNMAAMSDDDWGAYYKTIVTPNDDQNRPFGAYAIAARRRRHGTCPRTNDVANTNRP